MERCSRSARNVSSEAFTVNHRGLQHNRNRKICLLLTKSKLSLETLAHRWLSNKLQGKVLWPLFLYVRNENKMDLPSRKSLLFLHVMTLSCQPWQPKNAEQEYCLSFPPVSLHGCHFQIWSTGLCTCFNLFIVVALKRSQPLWGDKSQFSPGKKKKVTEEKESLLLSIIIQTFWEHPFVHVISNGQPRFYHQC